jgi:hypothetical protein
MKILLRRLLSNLVVRAPQSYPAGCCEICSVQHPAELVCNCVAGVYAGWFANALGNLNPKEDNQADPVEEVTEKPRSGKWAKWRTLILLCCFF